jgi:hypothetical protein
MGEQVAFVVTGALPRVLGRLASLAATHDLVLGG